MSHPETVVIGPLVYTVASDVSTYAQAVVEHNEQVYGRIQHSEGRIILDPKQQEQHKRIALLHEVLHGCWHTTDPLDPHDCEERAIRTLSGPLLDTLRRNPALVAYLLSEE